MHVCVPVSAYTCEPVCVPVSVYTCEPMRVSVRVYTCESVHVSVSVYTCEPVCICECIYMWASPCVPACECTHMWAVHTHWGDQSRRSLTLHLFLRDSLSLNLRLTYSWLSWRLTCPSDPPESPPPELEVKPLVGAHVAPYAGVGIRTPGLVIRKQVLFAAQASL